MKQFGKSYLILFVVLGGITVATVFATGTVIPFTPPYQLNDTSNNAVRLYVDNSGNVGIGTSTPLQKLEVAGGNAQFDQQAILARQNFASLQTYPTSMDQGILNFYQAQNFPSANAYYRSLDIVSGSANTASIIRFLTSTIGSGATPTEVARIDQSGNVGIGTTGPVSKLDIVGNLTAGPTDPIAGSNQQSEIVFRQVNKGTPSYPPLPTYTMDGTAKLNYYADCTNNSGCIRSFDIDSSSYNTQSQIKFFTSSDGGAVAEKMRISANGNVGIGTTSPTQKLDVNGNIRVGGNLTSASTNEFKISAPSGVPICIGAC